MSTLPPPSRFSRERDYVRLVELVGRLRRAGGSAFLHPGGLQWLLRRTALGDFAMWVWYDGDDLVAFVVEDGDYAMPHADTTRVDLIELLRWTERHAHDAGRRELEISVWDADSALRDAIARAGYQPTGQFGPELVWRMAGEPPRPSLPAGYRFVRFDASMDDAYVAMHRDAWSRGRPSDYRRDLHDLVASAPQFDRDLVPIVAAPDGTLASYCIGWFDPVTRWTEIEPLGTRPAHERRGLARAVVREVIHRSWQRGAEAVLVWGTDPSSTAHVNESAWRLYTTSGMRPERVLREYRRRLDASG